MQREPDDPPDVPVGDQPRPAPAAGPDRGRPTRRRRLGGGLLVLLALWAFLVLSLRFRALPEGTRVAGPWRPLETSAVSFLADLTYVDAADRRVHEQHIFDALFELIARAQGFLVLDFFLVNDFAGDPETAPRALSGELVDALLAARERDPELRILMITDPINRVYGSERHPGFERLEAAGVEVVETRLDALRDSNPTWSALYRTLFRWSGNEVDGGFLPNPFLPGDDTTIRSYMRLLNFKANHRKVAIAGSSTGPPRALVTSANPHDASSAHSNVAILFEGDAALDLLSSELAVARFSGWEGEAPPVRPAAGVALSPEEPAIRALTEGAIRDALLEMLAVVGDGDSVDVAMFYLGQREVVDALVEAAERGASVRLVLDPNRDAFGRTKNGIPNRSVAHELIRRSRDDGGEPIQVRWYATSGEQFHTKLVMTRAAGATHLLLGSANLTRRNIDDFNLETNVEVRLPAGSGLESDVATWFERVWTNGAAAGPPGRYTLDYDAFADESSWSAWRYRWMEATGLSTF